MLKWSRFRRFSRGEQSEDRQPDDNCADRPFHNDEGYPADRRALGLNESARRTSSDTYASDSACKLSVCAMHVYNIRPRAARPRFDLISDALHAKQMQPAMQSTTQSSTSDHIML